jgi:hypothetical protein
MSIFKTAYDTTLGHAFDLHKTVYGIKAFLSSSNAYLIRETTKIADVNIISSGLFSPIEIGGGFLRSLSDSVGFFNHPLAIEHYKDTNFLCLDTRLYRKSDARGDVQTVNKTEFEFVFQRFLMNVIWLNDNPREIRKKTEFADTIYANWISEVIARRFALDIKEQLTISVIAHLFYQQLHMDDVALDETHKQKMAVAVNKSLNVPLDFVFKIVDATPAMPNIIAFCDEIKKQVENIRLENFNYGALFTIVANSWYGNNGKENIAVALEHVPTWLAIAAHALTNRSYRHSTISNIANKYNKKGQGEKFIKEFMSLLQTQIVDNEKSWASLEEQILSLESKTF